MKSGQGCLSLKSDAGPIGGLDAGDAVLEDLVGGATVALKGKLHVLGRHRLAVVKFRLAQDEFVNEAVVGLRPGPGRGWAQRSGPASAFTKASCRA